jgi:hypothetical protein
MEQINLREQSAPGIYDLVDILPAAYQRVHNPARPVRVAP